MRKFLLPVKGSAHDRRAAVVAALLAREANGTVTIFHVTGPEETTPGQEASILHMKNEIDEVYAVDCVLVKIRAGGDIGAAIVAEAKRDYAYLILGARQDASVDGKVVGKTSKFVFDNSPIPLIIVKDVLPDGAARPAGRGV